MDIRYKEDIIKIDLERRYRKRKRMRWMKSKDIKRDIKIMKYKRGISRGALYCIPEDRIISSKKYYYDMERKRLKRIRRRVRDIDNDVNRLRIIMSTYNFINKN